MTLMIYIYNNDKYSDIYDDYDYVEVLMLSQPLILKDMLVNKPCARRVIIQLLMEVSMEVTTTMILFNV